MKSAVSAVEPDRKVTLAHAGSSISQPAASSGPITTDAIAARLERLPSSKTLWRFVVLLSLGGFFEFYELFSTAYVMPGIVRSGILSTTTAGVLSVHGIASYIAATFGGLFIGTFVFGFVADKCGRRATFTYSLLWYCACSVIMACQNDAAGLNFWRLMSGIGLGVELVTIDAYLSELVPAHMRGRAFALNQCITYCAVPTVGFLSWRLVPLTPYGIDGWRWVIALGAIGSLLVWWLRRGLPESPRWLAGAGRHERADQIVRQIEDDVRQDIGTSLKVPRASAASLGLAEPKGHFRELWNRKYAPRTWMLLIFHIAQTIALYGFANWVPTFLIQQGVTVSSSLGFALTMACVMPFGPLLAMGFADRIERKRQIVAAALLVGAAGLALAQTRTPALIILFGCAVTLGATVISLNFHAYQSELFPTRIRAMAVGFVYSSSRVSGIASGFLIAYMLRHYGAEGALTFISSAMGVVALAIGLLGPHTRGLTLEEIND
jgi:putative MFS transporter